jgi:hypothetical protein
MNQPDQVKHWELRIPFLGSERLADGWAATRMIIESRFGRLATMIVCSLFLIFGLYRQIRAQSTVPSLIDFYPYYNAALAIRHHVNPYLPVVAAIDRYVPGHALPGLLYVYAPLFAILLIPLTLLPFHAALVVWDVCLLAFLLGGMYTFARAVGMRLSLLTILFLGAAVSLQSSIRDEFYLAQADIFLLFLVCVAFWAFAQRNSTAGGIVLAAACVIKPQLLILVAFLVWKREIKSVIVTIVAYLALLLTPFLWLGGQSLRDALTAWQFWSNQLVSFDNNAAPKAILARLFTVNEYVHPLVVAPVLMTAIWLALALGVTALLMAVVSQRPFGPDVRSFLELGIVITAMLLISPLTEYIHLTLLVLPLLALFAALRQADWTRLPYRRVAIGFAACWLLLYLPLQHVTWYLSWYVRFHAGKSPLVTLAYAFLAATYLPIMAAILIVALDATSLITGRSTTESGRQFVRTLADQVVAWVRLGLKLPRSGGR